MKLLLLLAAVVVVKADNVGWQEYFTETTTRFHDLPLEWESGMADPPAWLSGTYIRSGFYRPF